MQEMRQRKFDKGLELQQGLWTFPHRHGGHGVFWSRSVSCDLICILESSVLGGSTPVPGPALPDPCS